jgi:Uma2 family endonuclease
MSAILEIPEVRQRVSHLTVADYHRLSEQNEDARGTELIRGIVIEKMSKSPLHGTILSALIEILGKKVPRGFLLRQDQPLTFVDSEPEPDVVVVRGTRAQFSRCHPSTASLVIEIAVSSVALDRANTTLYAEAAVTEYWIVLAAGRQVEVYRDPSAGTYKKKAVFGLDDIIECVDVPSIKIPVAKIFADVR